MSAPPFGNRKLEDGNMCKDCANLLSPFTTDRRRTSISDIKEHLVYRQANKTEVEKFNVTRTIGNSTKILLDEDAGKFIVTSSNRWQSTNPDVMTYGQVTGCELEIKENKSEIYSKDAEGKEISYNPARYESEYDFEIMLHIKSPWFSEISFNINDDSIDNKYSVEYNEASRQATEIKEIFSQIRVESRNAIPSKTAVICSLCGASTMLDASGKCEYCGGVNKS